MIKIKEKYRSTSAIAENNIIFIQVSQAQLQGQAELAKVE